MISIGVQRYCCEDISNIENYEEAVNSPEKWDCHHRFELKCPVYSPAMRDLMDWNLYYNRPADELIFLKHSEHMSLHNKGNTNMSGKHLSEETRGKISKSKKGKRHSEETKRKISEAHKGDRNPAKRAEVRRKLSELRKGRELSEEWRRKISEAKKEAVTAYKEYKANGGTLKWNEWLKCRKCV